MIQCGPHFVTEGSLTGSQVDSLFADGRRARVMFGDPPWGEGNVKFWATKARKDTGRDYQPISYDQLISRWFELADRYVDGHIFLETGHRWTDDALRRMALLGLRNVQTVELTYKGGGKTLTNMLLYGVKPSGGNGVDISSLYHMTGQAVSRKAIAMVRDLGVGGGIVFDPCCGMGYSAQAAIDNGMEFRGNELNPVRLQKTIARLERAVR